MMRKALVLATMLALTACDTSGTPGTHYVEVQDTPKPVPTPIAHPTDDGQEFLNRQMDRLGTFDGCIIYSLSSEYQHYFMRCPNQRTTGSGFEYHTKGAKTSLEGDVDAR